MPGNLFIFNAYTGKCDKPITSTSSVSGGYKITFSCSTSGVTFRYTTDGSIPTTGSASGTSVTLTSSGTNTIKVIATKTGYSNSDVTSVSIVV